MPWDFLWYLTLRNQGSFYFCLLKVFFLNTRIPLKKRNHLCWGWNSNTLTTSCKELTQWKRPWCWEVLGAGGEVDDRGWDGRMSPLTRWTWFRVNSGSWWWTGRPGMLRFTGSQRVRHDWATELNLNWTETTLYDTIMVDTSHYVCLYVQVRCVQLFETLWTVTARLLCPWNFPAGKLQWIAISSSRGCSWLRYWTQISCVFCIGRRILYHCATWEALHVGTLLSKAIKYTVPRVHSNANYKLWLIRMCQCRVINCNKCITVVGGCP